VASALAGLPVVRVGVRCAPEVAAARERGRPDRVDGMARLQAGRVHEGVVYDLVVDTTAEQIFRQVTAGQITSVRLEGVGHLVAQEAPEALAAAIGKFTEHVDHG
jgi:hypothetical protein